MADDDYVRFEITDHDLQDEFNPNRHSRRTTKHQQIYGVFADSDDSDASTGDARGGRRRGGGGGRQHAKPQKDYTAHVPFVSGGVQGRKKASKSDGDSNASDDDKDANNVDATIEDDVADAAAAGVVVSSESSDEDAAPSSAAYRGFGMENMAGFRQSNASIGTGNVADAKWDKHTKGIGAKLLLKMGYKPGGGLGKNLQGIAQPVQAHVRKGRGAIGLYGTEQGQTIGSSSAAATAKAGQKIDEDRREQQEFQQQMHQWRKTAGGRTGSAAASASHRADNGTGRAGPRYVYRTVEDVIERGHRQPNSILSERASAKLSNVTVIDMTGPEKRILSGYHALGQQRQPSSACVGPDSSSSATAAGKQRDNFRMPELEHNLQLIVDQCEQDIITIDKSQRSCADQQQQLKADQLELGVIVDLERKHIGALERVAALVQRLVGETNADTGELKNDNGGALTLAEVERTFGILQREYAAEYRDFGLADLAPGVVGPLISMELLDWRPLEEPTRGADIVARWREILAVGGGDNATTTQQPQPPSSDAKKSPPQPTEALHLSPYAALVWASIIPHLRRTCSDDWDPRQHAPMAGLLDAWSSLLPAQQLDHVLDRMVLPRIVRAVDEWDPLTDTVPVHAWLLPWHQLLDHATGGRLDERVYERIRQKLGAALVAWRPVDRSARAMLEPWLGVFADAAMEVFLVRNIVPKLQQSLVELVVSPMQQDLELWLQVSEWQPIIPVPLMSSLLERHFFPKWLQTLVIWLNQSPNLDQVSRWYSGWKAQFGNDLLEQPAIKEQFNRALGLMQRTLANQESSVQQQQQQQQPPMMQHLHQQHHQQQHQQHPLHSAPIVMMDMQHQLIVQPPIPPPPQLDFRELVSQKCAERGITFVPMAGRNQLGKQVYRVGKLFCYIERAVIMLSDSSLSNWAPVSLQTMLDRSCTGATM